MIVICLELATSIPERHVVSISFIADHDSLREAHARIAGIHRDRTDRMRAAVGLNIRIYQLVVADHRIGTALEQDALPGAVGNQVVLHDVMLAGGFRCGQVCRVKKNAVAIVIRR